MENTPKKSLPPGLIVDAAGAPSLDPADFYAGGALQTFGLHKGSGLSVMRKVKVLEKFADL